MLLAYWNLQQWSDRTTLCGGWGLGGGVGCTHWVQDVADICEHACVLDDDWQLLCDWLYSESDAVLAEANYEFEVAWYGLVHCETDIVVEHRVRAPLASQKQSSATQNTSGFT
jgi:hypothetical protein